MTEEEYLKLGFITPSHILKASCLSDRSNRTLVYGFDLPNHKIHLYYMHDTFNIIEIYKDTMKQTSGMASIDILNTQVYLPKNLYIDCCDFEFFSHLVANGVKIESAMHTLGENSKELLYRTYFE